MDDSLQGARARLLLVDDTELNRDLIGAILTCAGFAVDVASDGETAWELTWSKRYDLVLMDLEMPGMSGFEAAARIRAREGVMSGVPIAALTATHAPDAEQFSLWSGIDEFIAKPVEPGRLVARVEAILAERRAGNDSWQPVWRLQAFANATCGLDDGSRLECLEEFGALLDEIAAAIHVHATGSERVLWTTAKLGDLAGRYGFDELAGLCALYGPTRVAETRSRDPNLYGAIGRARYAIRAYRQEPEARPSQAQARGRINVRRLFTGLHAA